MFCETITFLTPAVQLDIDHTMVNSSPVTSLSYLESGLILVTKNRSIAPTAKLLQLEIEMTITMKNMRRLCFGI